MKSIVLNRIYEEIEKNNGISIKELITKTGFCATTIYKGIKELIMQGLIREEIREKAIVYVATTINTTNNNTTNNNITGINDNNNNNNNITTKKEVKEVIDNNNNNNNNINVIEYDMRDYIPKKDNYIHREIKGKKDFEILETAYRNKQNVLLIGPKGSGKTFLIKNFCAEKQIPYARVNLDGAITPEDLVGSYVRTGNNWAWSDGLLTRFVRHGGIIVIDEINAGPPEMLFILHSLLDSERQLVLKQKDSEIIKANENFMLIACMNEGYTGTQELNEALLDRFDIVLYIDYDDLLEEKLIENKKLLEFAKNVRAMKKAGKINSDISTRMLIQFQQNLKLYGYEIAKESMLNKIFEDDRSAIGEALDMFITKQDDENIENHESDDNDENDENESNSNNNNNN